MTDREIAILRLRRRGVTLKAIAGLYSVSPERVRQIQAKAIRKQRHILAKIRRERRESIKE